MFYALDDHTRVAYLEVPGKFVVLLQAFFELYEGVGIVRTLDIRRSLVSILVPTALENDCKEILNAIRGQVPWRLIDPPDIADRFLGYHRKGGLSDA